MQSVLKRNITNYKYIFLNMNRTNYECWINSYVRNCAVHDVAQIQACCLQYHCNVWCYSEFHCSVHLSQRKHWPSTLWIQPFADHQKPYSFVHRAWIELCPLIFGVPSCFKPRQQNMISSNSNFWFQDSCTPALVLSWHFDLFILAHLHPKHQWQPNWYSFVVRKNAHFRHHSHLSSTYWTHEMLFSGRSRFLRFFLGVKSRNLLFIIHG